MAVRNEFIDNNLMFQKKSKALFAEVSAYELRLARADRFASPLQVEAFCSVSTTSEDDARRAVEKFAGAQKGAFHQASCAVYPGDRFLHRYFTDNAARTKGDDFKSKVLADELKRTPKDTVCRVIHPGSGKAYDPVASLSRELIFAGAGKTAIREEQSRILGLGLYPSNLRLATISLFEGSRKAVQEEGIEASVLFLELGEHGAYAYVVNSGGLALSQPVSFGISAVAEQIQKELGLQDALSARKVMFSATFDFKDMANALVGRLIRQIQASTGQFEVKTGKSVNYIHTPGLPKGLGWIGEVLADKLGMEVWTPRFDPWLERTGIQIAKDFADDLTPYFSLLCHMANLETQRS